jgi:prevent-host-death family protein
MTQQFINVTEARANFKNVVSDVASGKAEVILIRDSKPQAVLIPYDQYRLQKQSATEKWDSRFAKLVKKTGAIGNIWAKKQGIDLKKTSEDELYAAIDNV